MITTWKDLLSWAGLGLGTFGLGAGVGSLMNLGAHQQPIPAARPAPSVFVAGYHPIASGGLPSQVASDPVALPFPPQSSFPRMQGIPPSRPHLQHDNGQHRGWHKHDKHHGDKHDHEGGKHHKKEPSG